MTSAISFAFLKTASYGEMFWLPEYLKDELGMAEQIAMILTMVEVGNVFGNLITGYVTDLAKMRFTHPYPC